METASHQSAVEPFATSGVLQGLELVGEHPDRIGLDWRGDAFPAWLKGGAMLRNGPSLYEVGQDRYKHLFDGLAMLRGFYFDESGVSFASRYLRSPDYLDSTEHQRICYTQFGTAADRTWWERAKVLLNPNTLTGENCAINVIPNGTDWWAIGDLALPMTFDPRTLETGHVVKFADDQRYLTMSPHPQFDARNSEWINFGIGYGLEGLGYRVYRRKSGSTKREEIAFVERLLPAYMHSFALTENFVVLAEHPFTPRLELAEVVFRDHPVVDGFGWHGDQPTRFIVIDRTLNRFVCEIEIDPPILVLHHANAFEDRGRIVIDICAYDDDKIVRAIYLDKLASGVNAPAGRLRRYTLDPATQTASCEKHEDIGFEMPRFNDAHMFKPYTALYGNSKNDLEGRDFFDSLVKINPVKGSKVSWTEKGAFPGEPVFVARPGATAEDDGVVLCVVRNPGAGHFYLLVLDGQSFKEVGRAVSRPGVHIAPGLHGTFVFLDSRRQG